MSLLEGGWLARLKDRQARRRFLYPWAESRLAILVKGYWAPPAISACPVTRRPARKEIWIVGRMRPMLRPRSSRRIEANSAQQMQGVGAQAPQMIEQMVSSITGALGGAVGGIMGPLTQLPQQAMQAGQSAIQPLMSAVQGAHGAGSPEAADESRLVDSLGGEPGAGGGGAGGGVGGLGSGGGGNDADRLSGSTACADVFATDDSCWGSRKVGDGDTARWHAACVGADGDDRYADDAAGRDGPRWRGGQ